MIYLYLFGTCFHFIYVFMIIGNIQKSSLKELVYKELTELETWLKVRSKETPCKQCINKDLCPSISNYELVIGKNNLCNIQHR